MHCKGMQNAQQCDLNYKIGNFCKKYKSTMQKYIIARGCKSTAYCTAEQAAVKAAPLLPRQLSPRCSGCRAFNSGCTKRGKEGRRGNARNCYQPCFRLRWYAKSALHSAAWSAWPRSCRDSCHTKFHLSLEISQQCAGFLAVNLW